MVKSNNILHQFFGKLYNFIIWLLKLAQLQSPSNQHRLETDRLNKELWHSLEPLLRLVPLFGTHCLLLLALSYL